MSSNLEKRLRDMLARKKHIAEMEMGISISLDESNRRVIRSIEDMLTEELLEQAIWDEDETQG